MKRLLNRFFTSFYGQLRFQPFFERLHLFALRGMNYDMSAGLVAESGEINAMKHIRQLLNGKEDIILFDVGANVGNYCIQLAAVFQDTPAVIHAFEPSAKMYPLLVFRTRAYPFVIHHKCGISDKKTTAKMYHQGKSIMAANLYVERIQSGATETEEVMLTTIDEFCLENNISHIDLLKLDIEGHELKALQGATRMLSEKKIRFIQFELSFANMNSNVFFIDFYLLLAKNYNIYRIVKDGLYPVEAYGRQYEVFLVANFLAELK